MVYRPPRTVAIDWDDAGDYSHAEADVSDDVYEYVVSMGMESDYDGSELLNTPATGSLQLISTNSKYDYSSSTTLTAAQLTTPHRIRMQTTHTISGTDYVETLWEGIARPPIIDDTGTVVIAELELEGRQAQARRQQYELTAVNRSVSDEVSAISALVTPTGVTEALQPPTQTIRYLSTSESLQAHMDQLGAFSGSLVMEDSQGGLRWHTLTALAGTTATTDLLTSTYQFDARAFRVVEDVDLIRNRATLTHHVPANQSNVRTDYTGTTVGAGLSITYTPPTGASVVDGSWQITVNPEGEVGQVVGAAPNSVVLEMSGNLTITWTNLQAGQSYHVILILRLSFTEELTIHEYEDAASIASYGERRFEAPEWYDGTAAGFAVTTGYLNIRKSPRQVVAMGFPEWQDTAVQSQGVAQIKPGVLYNMRVTDALNNRTVAKKVVCVGVDLQGGHQQIPSRLCQFLALADLGAADNLIWDTGMWDVNTWG